MKIINKYISNEQCSSEHLNQIKNLNMKSNKNKRIFKSDTINLFPFLNQKLNLSFESKLLIKLR